MNRSKWTHVPSNLVRFSGKTNGILTVSPNVVLCQYMHEITVKEEAYEIYKNQRKDKNKNFWGSVGKVLSEPPKV